MWIWTCIAFEGQLHDCLKFLIGPSGGALRDHTRTGCRPMLHWTWVYPPCFCGRDVQRKWERNRDEAVANKRDNGNVEQCAGEITWPQYEPIHHLGKTEHFLGLLGRTFNNYGLCIYHQQLCPCKILQSESTLWTCICDSFRCISDTSHLGLHAAGEKHMGTVSSVTKPWFKNLLDSQTCNRQ